MRHPYRAGRRNVFHIQVRHRERGALRRGHQSPHPALTLDAPDAAWDVVLVVDAEKSENPF